MIFLRTSFFNLSDFLFLPAALIFFYGVAKYILKKEDQFTKKIFFQSFWIRLLMLFVFALLMQFYYGGGDTSRYYISILDMRKALQDGTVSLWDIIKVNKVNEYHPLYHYFSIDELGENQYYMMTAPNYTVPKIGLIFSQLFGDSYLALSFCFSFFALAGSYHIYRVFKVYFPAIKRQIALACFFIPTVCFWSSGLLKDSLTFGAVGFLTGGFFNIFIKRAYFISSAVLVSVSVYILYYIKAYILIAFMPALILFIFTLLSTRVRSANIKKLVFFLMLICGLFSAFLLYQYLTSEGQLTQFSSEKIFDQIDAERGVYEKLSQIKEGSYFSLGSQSPLLIFPLGLIATYFRPFIFEVSNPVMFLSAIESLIFFFLVSFMFYKVGLGKTLKIIINNPFTLFCFVFSFFFGGAVGISTGNFGTLVRYKIPGMPFFLLTIILVLNISGVVLPKWFRKITFLNRE